MVVFLAMQVRLGKIKLEQVPERYREEVKQIVGEDYEQ